MINRILIRIKVVQLLYSYLLTRNDFELMPKPADDASNDKKFAYAVYVDLLLLMLEITGNNTNLTAEGISGPSAVTPDKKLAVSQLARALMAMPEVRKLMILNQTDIDVLRPIAQQLHDKIRQSAVYAEFRAKRKAPTLAEEVALWATLLQTVVVNDHTLISMLRTLPGFSNVGFRNGVNQLVNSLQAYSNTANDYLAAKKSLEASLDKAYELYNSMFVLMIELTREQERRIDVARSKYLASPEERNPNMRFVDNALVAALQKSDDLKKYLVDNPVAWDTETSLINSLLNSITSSKIYQDYMNAPENDAQKDIEFWVRALRDIVFPSDELAEVLENRSVYWNDDLPIMSTFVVKTLKLNAPKFQDLEPGQIPQFELLPQYKDEEDAKFGAELFVDAVKNRIKYRQYIDQFIDTESWDTERIAFMDIVIMLAAIAEIINYPNVPLAVTMNEYIEIANAYSAPKSGQFVNGTLYNVADYLYREGMTFKSSQAKNQ